MHITIIGSGAFGCALAHLIAKNNNIHLHLWTHDKNWADEIEKNKHFQSFNLKENITIYTDLSASIQKSSFIIIAVSSSFFEIIAKSLKEINLKNKTIFIGTKGMLNKDPFFLTSYLKKHLNALYIGSFGGPNLAQDILNDAPISMVYSIKDSKTKKQIQNIFSTSVKLNFLRNPKIIELSNVMKNIYAIGSGIILAKTSSKSTNLSYLSMAFMELTTTLNKLFILPKPFVEELLGDFFLTGTMEVSRNLSFGKSLANNNAKEFLENNTVEGYINLETIKEYLKKEKISLPIFDYLYSIIKKEGDPSLLLSIIFQN